MSDSRYFGSRLSDSSALTTPNEDASTATLNRGRPLQIVAPLHYQANYQYPTIVWLHHSGHNERQIEHVLPHISVRNYLGIGVRGIRATDVRGCCFDWSKGRSAMLTARDAINEALEITSQEFAIHPDRIILAGYGSGATMACQIAMLEPTRFAGVVRMGGEFPVCGGSVSDFDQLRQRRLPMLWQQSINGVDDAPKKLKKEIAAAETICARVEIRQYRDTEVMNTVALRDIDSWCFDKIVSPRSGGVHIGGGEVNAAQWIPPGFSAN